MGGSAVNPRPRPLVPDRCEYCHFPAALAELSFETDHIVAKKHGGTVASDNLAWACFYCNRYKGTNIAGIDPEEDPAAEHDEAEEDEPGAGPGQEHGQALTERLTLRLGIAQSSHPVEDDRCGVAEELRHQAVAVFMHHDRHEGAADEAEGVLQVLPWAAEKDHDEPEERMHADGDVHTYFNPHATPYDAYISFMNVMSDLERRSGEERRTAARVGAEWTSPGSSSPAISAARRASATRSR